MIKFSKISKQIFSTSACLTLASALLLPTAEAATSMQSEISLSWASRYVSQGIANAHRSPFVSAEASTTIQDFTFRLWWGEALSNSYNEVNLFAGYGMKLGTVDLLFGVTRLEYPSDAEKGTWEASIGAEMPVAAGVVLFADAYYDFAETHGGFLEVGAKRQWVIGGTDERLSVEPYVLCGFDYGYVTGDTRRFTENQLQFGVKAAWAVTESIEVFARIDRSQRLTNLVREGEKSFTWGGFGTSMTF